MTWQVGTLNYMAPEQFRGSGYSYEVGDSTAHRVHALSSLHCMRAL
jgi:serine/threonine protein kinase